MCRAGPGGRVRRQRLRGAQRHHELLPIANGVDEDVATLAHRSAARARSVACRCEVERRRTRRRETSEERTAVRRLMLPTRVILQKHPNRGTRTGETSPLCIFQEASMGTEFGEFGPICSHRPSVGDWVARGARGPLGPRLGPRADPSPARRSSGCGAMNGGCTEQQGNSTSLDAF